MGPTPDDVTLKGVAEAFGVRLSRDPTLEQRLRSYFGDHLTAAHLKFAEVPEGAPIAAAPDTKGVLLVLQASVRFRPESSSIESMY